ncbi:MAG TPA: hypothetical protein VMT85_09650 [Thermoanaerobaculia bacterium]|nr:hypothetical protein [Thermoanaerobaculia bacterium]
MPETSLLERLRPLSPAGWLRFLVPLLVLSVSPSSSQTPQPPRISDQGSLRESIVVRESTLYVRVLGPRGPVRGIERDRFHVLLDGRELDVVAFDELSSEPERRPRRRSSSPAEAAGDPEPEPPAGRSVLVVVDVMWTPREYVRSALGAVRGTLDELGEGDRVAISVLGIEASLIQPFTTDRELLGAALELVEASVDTDAARTRSAFERFAGLSRQHGAGPAAARAMGLRGALALDSEIGRSLSTLPDPTFERALFRYEVEDDLGDFAVAELAAENAVAQAAVESTESFSNLVRLLGDVPGPRYALLLSRGMPNWTQVIEDGIGSGDPRIGRSGAGSALLANYQSLAYVLEGHGFVVQAVDVTGVGGRSTAFSMVDTAPRPELNSAQLSAIPELALRGGLAGDGSDSLFFLAEATGGELYDNYNRLETAVRRAYDNSSHHYRLVVSLPSDPAFFEKRRRQTLQVRVDDLGARVRVTSSLAAEWALPGFLRHDDPVDVVRAELLGERTAGALRPQDARLAAFRQALGGSGSSRLQRAIVLLDVDTRALLPAVLDGRGALTLHVIALPLEPEPGARDEFLDLASGAISWTAGEDARERLLFAADVIVPCEGALIRARLAGADQERSWVFERELAPACAEPPGWMVPLRDEAVFFGLEEDLDVADAERNPLGLGAGADVPVLRAVARAGERLGMLVRSEPSSAGAPSRSGIEFRDLSTGDTRVLPFEVVPQEPDRGTQMVAVILDLVPGRYEATLANAPNGASSIVTVLP